MEFLRKLFGLGPKVDYKALVAEGARILDVRTEGEFDSGHADGAVNIPLNEVHKRMPEIFKLGTPLILCCKSGVRASSAMAQIKKAGVKEVYNAGGWKNLK
ncbi:rhodanese-like domain-containing protein [Flammeovirga yaeyamensis]|uniref:Rhodanese-like domain-containing protein n=1 Tax=Flammeovirga yaeyamensis TaxID=367791 RepID=A0AAX1N2T4_9BACT|nr:MULTISPECIES: rhodanese-like domain-containing protein [Flammeovirga]ANQ48190.1 rhodanese-like domain-containing protein [Flammeovirga sp. MY04]MBB3696105.1 rhodanese-related sulfurtransferase [Flammeovirga yaeyamensis]NMF34790.1 rhodanese-like domain-containing protein [Flammeovirga yaeyamensis]QWG00382.1 rhodanese-like domain-containing protein [Flammeovirga yaeyamensis]